jgi:hypothetical protein
MQKEWHELTKLTQGSPLIIERVRLADSDVVIEGNFELPQLARLPMKDQVFIIAFIRCNGSIKEMERVFGISYPTVKNHLQRISKEFEFVESYPMNQDEDVLEKLEKGDISADEAIKRLSS